jgi:hypothetical protein
MSTVQRYNMLMIPFRAQANPSPGALGGKGSIPVTTPEPVTPPKPAAASRPATAAVAVAAASLLSSLWAAGAGRNAA